MTVRNLGSHSVDAQDEPQSEVSEARVSGVVKRPAWAEHRSAHEGPGLAVHDSFEELPTRVAPEDLVRPLREATRTDAASIDALVTGMSVDLTALAAPIEVNLPPPDEALPPSNAEASAPLEEVPTLPRVSADPVRAPLRSWTRKVLPLAGGTALVTLLAFQAVRLSADSTAPQDPSSEAGRKQARNNLTVVQAPQAKPGSSPALWSPTQNAAQPSVVPLFRPETERNPYDVAPAEALTHAADTDPSSSDQPLGGTAPSAVDGAPEPLDDWLSRDRSENAILRGHAQLEAGEYERARWSFERALSHDPADPQGHAGIGAVLLAQGNARRALTAFGRAVELDPSSAPFQVGLGRAYELKGDAKRATEAYRRALTLHPGDPDASARLAALSSQ